MVVAHKDRKIRGKVSRRYLVKFKYSAMDAKWMEEGDLTNSPKLLQVTTLYRGFWFGANLCKMAFLTGSVFEYESRVLPVTVGISFRSKATKTYSLDLMVIKGVESLLRVLRLTAHLLEGLCDICAHGHGYGYGFGKVVG